MRALDILEFVSSADAGCSTGEIAMNVDLPRSSLYELLATLTYRGYLTKSENQTYRIGISAFVLANGFTRSSVIREAGSAPARRISEQCSETVNLGVLDGDSAVILEMIETSRPVRTISRVGASVPGSCTALGKALLAYAPSSTLRTVSQHLRRITAKSVTDPDVFLQEMDEVRTAGVSWEFGESNEGVSCVGSPIWDETGQVVASMSITVPDMRWREFHLDHWRELAIAGADEVTRALGGRPVR